jgi:hypothetical protein
MSVLRYRRSALLISLYLFFITIILIYGWRDQAQVNDASLFIVICADLKSWKKQPERYWANAEQGIQDFLLPAIDQYYGALHQNI